MGCFSSARTACGLSDGLPARPALAGRLCPALLALLPADRPGADGRAAPSGLARLRRGLASLTSDSAIAGGVAPAGEEETERMSETGKRVATGLAVVAGCLAL